MQHGNKNLDRQHSILGMRINTRSMHTTTAQILQWAEQLESRYVCVANVHMCMEAFDDDNFQNTINHADWVVADGKPLSMGLKLKDNKTIEQIRGADLTLALCHKAELKNIKIGLYGSSENTLISFKKFLQTTFPDLIISCAIAPPYRDLTEQEDEAYIQQINDTGTQIILVGLGCPKQEKWMEAHKSKVNAVMIGVGAVFDFLSGNKKESPRFWQKIGLEWLFRLLCEPKRLWKRYLIQNPRFLWYFSQELLKINKVRN